jgi:hypothetical protein
MGPVVRVSDTFTFRVWAEGYATDADGNLLTSTGDLAEPKSDDEPEEQS